MNTTIVETSRSSTSLASIFSTSHYIHAITFKNKNNKNAIAMLTANCTSKMPSSVKCLLIILQFQGYSS
jgi:hypothetical protein